MTFDLLQIFDYLGTFAFAVSGVRLAASKKFDIFGAYVVGFVTAVGGGTIRDLCIGVTPFWMVQPSYVIITGIALLLVVFFKRSTASVSFTFFLFDALGLGFFTVVGLEKSMAAGFPFWVNIMMGCITGAAGGMLRDVLINEEPLIFRKDIYAVASLFGGLLYYAMTFLDCIPMLTSLLSLAAVVVIRVLSVRYKINLPMLTPVSEPEDDVISRKLHDRKLRRDGGGKNEKQQGL